MKEKKSLCPINQYLEVFGDKWTLLIIRDMMFVPISLIPCHVFRSKPCHFPWS